MSIIERARNFATAAHGNQVRKYTGEPYVKHCEAVACRVASVREATDDMIAAAWLHDVVEDCHVSFSTLGFEFGAGVADMVYWLSDKSKLSDGNRAQRKAIDRAHIANSTREAKTIKLADLIDNSCSILQHDPDFAKVYLSEKALLLPELRHGNKTLHDLASEIVMRGNLQLGMANKLIEISNRLRKGSIVPAEFFASEIEYEAEGIRKNGVIR